MHSSAAVVVQNATATLRERLKAARAALAAEFIEHPHPVRYLARHTALVDGTLAELCGILGLPGNACLVAVGGYGRGELFPGSDVDVMLLIASEPEDSARTTLERWIQACWDVGLEIGHSVRTVRASVEEADQDITIETSQMEARWVWGDKALFADFRSAFDARFNALKFFDAKVHEQTQRHLRLDDSAYKLEPNIKESPGGLRDLHTIQWLAQAVGMKRGWNSLVRVGLLTRPEALRIARYERWLARLRIHLHLLAKRREDRLAFDFQTELAERFRLEATPHLRAGERLMQSYYRAAKLIQRANDILLQSLRVRLQPDESPPRQIDADFQIRGQMLQTRAPNLFMDQPNALLRVFIVYAQHSRIRGLEPSTLRALWRATTQINAAFRADPANQATFIALLRLRQGVTRGLRMMHRYGVLGRYIPAFGRIVGQMQHDLFHVYTVDEHILMVLRNLRRFTVPGFAHEFPLASQLIASFEQPELLYLAALFHDIAKGRGGDHSVLGAQDARQFCRLHGFGKPDSELVAWLVSAHLLMSRTAQKEDLSDPEVIQRFAMMVGDTRRLVALYLLTVADIRGTSPKVWNAWKAKLLEDLFRATHRLLEGPGLPDDSVEQKQTDARNQLALYGLSKTAPDDLWRRLDPRYFLRHDARDIAWHARMLWRCVESPSAVVKARLSPVGQGIQVLVYTPDRPDIFLRICGFFTRIQYSIQEAKIHTTTQAYALDSFQVMDLVHHDVHYRDFLSFVEYELARDLDPARARAPVPKARLSRQQRHHPLVPTVQLDAQRAPSTFQLSVTCADRAGLLYSVAEVFLAHSVCLDAARIDTLGERAEDSFLIRGDALQTPEGLQAFKADLLRVLSG